MAVVVITGARGFIGRNLAAAVREQGGHDLREIDRTTTPDQLTSALRDADAVFHLAGANRPADPADFERDNVGMTALLGDSLRRLDRRPLFVLSSSTQAANESPYGVSKRHAEEYLRQWADAHACPAVIYRLTNVFGKWCRPNYNSAVATFCHQVARDLPVTIHDPARELELVYVDDVVREFIGLLAQNQPVGARERTAGPITRIRVGDLAAQLAAFRASRASLRLPSLAPAFTRQLYATYLSHLEPSAFAYLLPQRSDPRGTLAEFIKQDHFGQVFISRTAPGITRGHHYHHTKTEKFFVVEGEAIVRFRHIVTGEQVAHRVRGTDFKVIDIPPGYAHSIENVGRGELVTLFWASEVFDPARTDTLPGPVAAFAPSSP
jgi:UDP-2-acetamido-2,6-beta-L-arabino-hexul-4-ose reductase